MEEETLLFFKMIWSVYQRSTMLFGERGRIRISISVQTQSLMCYSLYSFFLKSTFIAN